MTKNEFQEKQKFMSLFLKKSMLKTKINNKKLVHCK